MSVIAGPLCEEPMMGSCFIVEEVKILDDKSEEKNVEKVVEKSTEKIEKITED